jgi:hypothetical protein
MQKRVYLNNKQAAIAQSLQRIKTWIGGRGSGKSTVQGLINYQRIINLPRGKGFLAGLTYNQILTKFLPPALSFWESCGLVEYDDRTREGDYILGRKPPIGWAKPYQPPRRYENVISFSNGCAIELLSMDRPNTDRGGSYDWGDFDEAVLIPKDQHDKELVISIRGNLHHFNHHLHQSRLYTSTMPWMPSGNWLLEKKQDAISFPNDVFYIESTAFDNIQVLGQKYLDDLKRELPPEVYAVEVMNQRPNRLPDAFYPALEMDRHCYWNSFDYDLNEKGIYTRGVSDIKASEPLELSFDFGTFNSMIIAQDYRNEERIVDCLYVNNPKILDDLVDEFTKRYARHGKKHVDVYGDRNGNNRQANAKRTLYEEIKLRLTKAGWTVNLMVKGLDPAHDLKYELINKMLREESTRWPRVRINQNTCKPLLLSMAGARMTHDGKKDKRSERDGTAPELATHLSDCIDNLLYRKYSRLLAGRSVGSTMDAGFV